MELNKVVQLAKASVIEAFSDEGVEKVQLDVVQLDPANDSWTVHISFTKTEGYNAEPIKHVKMVQVSNAHEMVLMVRSL